MATRKIVKRTRKPVKKTMKKPAAKAVKKGARYACGVCGLVVAVDQACGCSEAHELICCDRVMKKKK